MLPKDKSEVKNEGPSYVPLEEGLYSFQIVDFFLKEKVKTPYGEKDQIRFYLALLDGERRGELLLHNTSTSFTAGFEGGSPSRLYELANAVTGDILDDKEPFDVNLLDRGVFRGRAEQQKSKTGKLYNKLVKVAPAGKGVKVLSPEEYKAAAKEMEELKLKLDGTATSSSEEEKIDVDNIDEKIE